MIIEVQSSSTYSYKLWITIGSGLASPLFAGYGNHDGRRESQNWD